MTHPADISPTTLDGIWSRLRAKPHLRSKYIDQEARGDESFGLWLFMIDARLHVTCGITHSDVSDCASSHRPPELGRERPRRRMERHSRRPTRPHRGELMPTTESLRTWAGELYPTEAAVELALRAFGVRFAEADQPWVIHEHGGDWIDATVLRFGSGDCPLLRISSRQTGWTNHG